MLENLYSHRSDTAHVRNHSQCRGAARPDCSIHVFHADRLGRLTQQTLQRVHVIDCRLLERNSRAAGGFSISITEDDTHASRLKLTCRHCSEWADWARLSEGVYILRTNIAQSSDEALWNTYIQLTEAEAAFRFQESDLAIRPIWHHKQVAGKPPSAFRELEPQGVRMRSRFRYS
jgi:hypothetical protein